MMALFSLFFLLLAIVIKSVIVHSSFSRQESRTNADLETVLEKFAAMNKSDS